MKHSQITTVLLSPISYDTTWQDVEIITLQQHTKDKAIEHVLTNLISCDNIDQQISHEMQKTKYKTPNEFISYSTNKILIGIDCNIITDTVIDKALNMLINISDDIKQGVYTFYANDVSEYDDALLSCVVH